MIVFENWICVTLNPHLYSIVPTMDGVCFCTPAAAYIQINFYRNGAQIIITYSAYVHTHTSSFFLFKYLFCPCLNKHTEPVYIEVFFFGIENNNFWLLPKEEEEEEDHPFEKCIAFGFLSSRKMTFLDLLRKVFPFHTSQIHDDFRSSMNNMPEWFRCASITRLCVYGLDDFWSFMHARGFYEYFPLTF